MAVSTIKAILRGDIRRVWETVTGVENYAWRSDLSKTERLNENQFVEYTKEGYATTFTITACELYRRWEFDMENNNMKGHWTGVFTQQGQETEIEFTEDVMAKKCFMKPFVKGFLKRQQALFVADLQRELLQKD